MNATKVIRAFASVAFSMGLATSAFSEEMYYNRLSTAGVGVTSAIVPGGTYGDINVPGGYHAITMGSVKSEIPQASGDFGGSFSNIIKKVGGPEEGPTDVHSHTVSGWFKVAWPTIGEQLVYAAESLTNNAHGGYMVRIDSAGKLKVGKADTDQWVFTGGVSQSEGTVPNDAWFYLTVVVTKDASARTASVAAYANGAAFALSSTKMDTNLNGNACEKFYLGDKIGAAGVRVDTTAVSDVETIKGWATDPKYVKSVMEGAYLWLDASAGDTILTDAGGNVTNWTTRSSSGISAKAYTSTYVKKGPTLLTKALSDKDVVDFGATTSGMDLAFDKETNIRTVFMVADVQTGTQDAFFLTDNETYNFHRGPNGTYFEKDHGKLFHNGTYCDGVKVADPKTTQVPSGYHLYSLIPNANATASRICQDRGGEDGKRIGGKMVAELIIFTEELPDATRKDIEAYLTEKWLTKPHEFAATIEANTNWSDIVWYPAKPAGGFGEDDVLTLTCAASEATVTMDEDVIAAKLAVRSAAKHALTLTLNPQPPTLNIPLYDFTAAKGKMTVGFDTLASDIAAGSDTVLVHSGAGKLTIGSGMKASISSWNGTKDLKAGGTLRFTAEGRRGLNDDTVSNATVELAGNYDITANSVLSTTNAKLRVSGDVVTSSTGDDTGMKGGTTLEVTDGKLTLNGRFVWNYDSQKATVSSDISVTGGELASESAGFLYVGSWEKQTANLNQSGGTISTRLVFFKDKINDSRLNVNVSGGTFAPSVIGLTTDGTTVLPGEDAAVTEEDVGAELALSGGKFLLPAIVPNWFTTRVPAGKTATIGVQDAVTEGVTFKAGMQLESGATLSLGTSGKTIVAKGNIEGADATLNIVTGTLDVTTSGKVALKSLVVKSGAVLRISADKPLSSTGITVEVGGKIDFVTNVAEPHILSATTGKLTIRAASLTDAFTVNGKPYTGAYKWHLYDGDLIDEAALRALCVTYGASRYLVLTSAVTEQWTTETIPGNPKAARKSERTDRTAKVSPAVTGEGLSARVRIIENVELHYTQYEVEVTNTTDQPIRIGNYYLLWQWAPEDFAADGVINGGTQGPVVQYRNARGYLGVENPQTDITCENGYATAILKRNYEIQVGETWSVKWVYGRYSEESQLRREFQAYLDNERAHPYRAFPHYNSWYDLCIDCKDDPDELKRLTEEKMYTSITNFRHHLSIEHKVWMKSYLADDGWDRWESLWDFHAGFANGFTNLYNTVKVDEGSSISCWMSPCGGYGSSFQKRLKYAKEHGYVPWSAQVLKLSMPGYYAAFRDRAISMITDYDMNLFKFDRMGSGGDCTGAGPEYAPDIAAVVRLTGEMRAKKQDVFINCTVGTWASPFWVMYADSIWRGEGDYGGQGEKWTIGNTVRQRWITYRDNVIYNRFANPNPLFPLNSLMNHGIIVANKGSDGTADAWSKVDTDVTLQDFCDEMWMSMACGTDLQEYYISPTLMHDRWWAALATGIKWLEANQETLRDVHWVGGDPFNEKYGQWASGKQGAIYGYASWSPSTLNSQPPTSNLQPSTSRGILILRNSHNQPLTLTTNFATIFELPSGCDSTGISSVTNVFSHRTGLVDYFKVPPTAYENVTFNLDAYDVLLIEVVLGPVDKYVAEMSVTAANLPTGEGLTEYTGSWTNDANRVIVITNAFEAATLDLGEAVTAACFVACQPASGTLALTSGAVPQIPYYAVRSGTLGLPETVVMSNTTFVTDKGATLLVTKSGLRETQVQNAGTVCFAGGTAEDPLVYAADGAKDGCLGAFQLAADAYVKVTTTDNKVYDVTGAGARASTLEVSCPGKGTGTTSGSFFRNVTLVANAGGDGFWIERKDSFDATVDLMAKRLIMLCNYSQAIGSLFGAGDIARQSEANTYTLTITPSVDAEYSGASPHRFTIAAAPGVETLSGNYTGELTVLSGGKCRLTGSARPHSIENNGTLNVTTIRDFTIRGTGKVDVVMTASEEGSKAAIKVFNYAATGEKPTIGRVFDEKGTDITAYVTIDGNMVLKRPLHGLMLFCK